MRLDDDFKKEVKKEVGEGTYVFTQVGLRVLVIAIILTIIATVGGVFIKKYQVEKRREIFKQSVTYTEGAASFLADSYKQFNEAESEEDRATIMNFVIMKYPNLDTDEIDNDALGYFYTMCLNGGK